MKIKCVKEIKEELTLNKVYALLGSSNHECLVVNDKGNKEWYKRDVFEPTLINANDIDKPDMVNHPDHYNYKSVECKDIIDVMCEGLEGSEAYEIGAAVKYLYRYPKKGNAIQDLKKAITYIKMVIDKLESEE